MKAKNKKRISNDSTPAKNADPLLVYEELEASRRRYSSLYELAPVGYFTFDRDGLIREVNPSGARQLGVVRSTLCGRPFQGFVSPKDWPAFVAACREVIDGETRLTREFELCRKDRSVFFARLECAPLRGWERDESWCLAAVVDITDLKQAEADLRMSHDEQDALVRERTADLLQADERLQTESGRRARAEEQNALLAAAVENGADAVIISGVAAEETILYVNPAFERLTGYSRREVLGRTHHLLSGGSYDEAFVQEVRDALARDNVWRGRLSLKKKGGAPYFVDCTCSVVKNPEGRIVNYVVVQRDITERLKLESIAEASNLMENTGFVFAGIRHELGNLVNSAKSILTVLLARMDSSPPELIRDYAGRALVELGRMERLLENLRSFSLYEKPVPEVVDTASFLAEFLNSIAGNLAEQGIAVATEVGPGAERIVTDPRALRQTLLNIVLNAADALTGREDPRIGIAATRCKGGARIRVTDNGWGMTREQQQNLFKPFHTSKARGTGLGLVIVRKMLARMNGDIRITSVPDRGTTVDIQLVGALYGASR